MTIAMLEALSFGLGRLSAAASEAGHGLCLLTGDRSTYTYELSKPDTDHVRVVDVDTNDLAACAAALRDIPDLAGLINTTDRWALRGAELAERLGLPSVGIETVRLLRDKGEVRGLLYSSGLSRAPAVTVERSAKGIEQAVNTVGLPTIVKDSAGTASRAVWLIRDEQELQQAANQAEQAQLFGHLIAEPYFPGPIYSLETLSWEGSTRLLGVASHIHTPEPLRREEALAFPIGFPSTEMAMLEAWIGRVLATVGFQNGVAHTELAMTTEGPEVIEINGRIAGGVIGEAMCRSLDTNVYSAIIGQTLGERPALLDEDLAPRRGQGMIFLHPPEPGTLLGWSGLERLSTFPGNPEWFPTASPGDRIEHLADQRGSTAFVLAEGPNAELALYNAVTAASTISHHMESLATSTDRRSHDFAVGSS